MTNEEIIKSINERLKRQRYHDLAQQYQSECEGKEYEYLDTEHLGEFLQKHCEIKSEILKMIIPRHKICDICSREVGFNAPYTTLKSSVIGVASDGNFVEAKKFHICFQCWERITSEIAQEIWDKREAEGNSND